MTIDELYSVRHINREIELYKAKIQELRNLAEKTTVNYSGMPHGSGVKDKIGEAATAIVEYQNLLSEAVKRKTEQSIKINKYILEINDAELRNIMFLRFIQCKTWIEIGIRLGGGNTADGVRMRCKRYLNQNYKDKT